MENKTEQVDLYKRFYLSTEGYYFKYRPDRNNSELIRATLYNFKHEAVDDVAKSKNSVAPERSHHDIIEYFEARITLGIIKSDPNGK